jgi:anti-sigma-K factor RskA
MTINKPICGNELDWLAFCYAAGELSAQDTEQFETRLAGDQAAREALARAVELTQTVVAAETVAWAVPAKTDSTHVADQVSLAPATTRKSPYLRIWLGIGIAAAILLALNLAGLVDLTVNSSKQSSPLRAQLAFAWTEARAQMVGDSEDGVWPALDALHEAEDDFSADVLPSEFAEAPSWLTAALLGQMSAAPGAESLNNGPLEN